MAIDKDAARAHLSAFGIDFTADFHTLPSAQVEYLADYAKAHGYRKPKNANGSTGRYFFAMLTRPRYETEFIVQGNYRHGWEDLTASLIRRDIVADIQAYRENAPETPYRLISRRVLKPYA